MAHHEFEPTRYYTAIGTYPPLLEVDPGDCISTTTVDSRGGDASGTQVTERGNPQTGPFAVRGAEPGDCLIVKLDKLQPNRAHGYTRGVVAPNVLDPGFVPEFDDDLKGDLVQWSVDTDEGTARVSEPEGLLSGVTLPLDPMVGCFGVAPPQAQAISTATSSTHGGNMDYRGFREGVTVYFPVFAPGGLFFLGDGHAVQGDGEIVGTGIEISFDVTFTLDLIKGKTIGWPRAECSDYLMVAGNARPLDQAVQHATTEMVQWLQQDFGLSARAAHVLLGQAVEYDLGNIFDPAYTMVCKMSKAVVAAV